MIIIFCVYEFYAMTQYERPSVQRFQCKLNLRDIGIALHKYHDQHGTFPPAYIADKNGKPMHSWRVLILPILGEEELYKQYNFDEPWDGPNNSKLHDKMPEIYQCPSDKLGHEKKYANYFAVLGKQTAWPHGRPVKLKEITDDHLTTILVVEIKNSGIHWMEPRDLEFDKMSFKIDDPDKPSISSEHNYRSDEEYRQAQALFVEGSVRLIGSDKSTDVLKAMLTIAGGEKIPD